MNSTETAAAEARLDLRIATASPGPYFFNPDLAAVALSLARALRTLGNTCGLDDEDEDWDVEGWISPEVPFAELKDALEALADWNTMLQSMVTDVVE